MKTINVKYIDTTPVVCTIDYDDINDNPLGWTTPEERGAWFVMSHSRYDVPKEMDIDFDDFDSYPDVIKAVLKKGQVYKYINWYEHSGIALSLVDTPIPTDRWDAGIAGFIIANSTEELDTAFSDYKAYMEGEVYCFTLEDAQGEFIDSCGGYYDIDAIKDKMKMYENITFVGEAV